jgi:cytochrome c peroxidase
MRVPTYTVLAALAFVAASAQMAPAQAPAPALVDRGKALFADTGLSGNGQISCATCHPANGHTDNKTYIGVDVVADGNPQGRSTPTLWGAGMRSAYSWAGTAPSLEANIRGIIVIRMKGAEPAPETLAALAAYVRSLPVPRGPGVGDDGAPVATASAAVKRGFELFVGAGGCATCHQLPSFDKKEVEDVGAGGAFKVPSLWAVSKTAPYFHDGRYASLADAVKYMWEFHAKKVGTAPAPSAAELADLIAYLEAL